MAWSFDPASGRYRDSAGRYLARSEVLAMANESMSATGSVAEALSSMASSGQLSPADFGILAREEIKGEYLRQYMLGVGGREQMTPSDYGSIGGMLKNQYHPYLDGFLQDIADGKLSEAQIQARLKMYTGSAHQAYEKAAQKTAKKAGFTEVYWSVDTGLENCDVCLAHQADGWQPIEDLDARPGDGQSPCGGHCGCTLTYRNPESGETY
jgi:hypothetical protein